MMSCFLPVALTALTKSSLSQALMLPGRAMFGTSGKSSFSSGMSGPKWSHGNKDLCNRCSFPQKLFSGLTCILFIRPPPLPKRVFNIQLIGNAGDDEIDHVLYRLWLGVESRHGGEDHCTSFGTGGEVA